MSKTTMDEPNPKSGDSVEDVYHTVFEARFPDDSPTNLSEAQLARIDYEVACAVLKVALEDNRETLKALVTANLRARTAEREMKRAEKAEAKAKAAAEAAGQHKAKRDRKVRIHVSVPRPHLRRNNNRGAEVLAAEEEGGN